MLAGREGERAALDRMLEQAREGRSGVLVMHGEAGIGKSALCGYASERAVGFTVVGTRGVESQSELAFAGLADLARPLWGHRDALPEPQAAALAGALAMGPPVAGDRYAVYAGALSLLAAAAEKRPLLVVVDDVQWVDSPSSEALSFITRRIEADSIAMVFALRDREPSAFDSANLPRLHVGGLDASAARAVLSATAGAVDQDVAERLVAATGGVPLALVELAGVLTPEQLAGRAPLDDPIAVPLTASEAIGRRIAALPDRCQAALVVAAANDGRGAGELGRALDRRGLGFVDLEPAEDGGLLGVGDEGFDFVHPLVRASAYQRASPTERRAAHKALAENLTEEPERAAWHLAACTVGPSEQVARALEEAAASFRSRGASATAARALERAARATDDPHRRGGRLRAAADDAQLAGRTDWALELLDQALEVVVDPVVRADVEAVRGRIDNWQGGGVAARRRLTAAADEVAAVDPVRAAALLVEASVAAVALGDVRSAQQLADRARQLATDDGVTKLLARVQLALADVILAERRDDDLADAIEALLRVPSLPPAAVTPLWLGISALVWFERFERAQQLLEQGIGLGRAVGALGALPYALATLAQLRFRTGDWSSAYALAGESRRLAVDTGQRALRGYGLDILAVIEAARGDEHGVERDAGEALDIAREFSYASTELFARHARGLLELGHGRAEAAAAELEQVRSLAATMGICDPGMVQHGADLVEAHARCGAVGAAEDALAELEDATKASGRRWGNAVAARCRGILAADATAAEEAFAAALRHHDEVPIPFERARTELCLGERRRRERRRAAARVPLESALRAFERLGANVWAERARRELGAVPTAGGSAATTADGGLTPHELQVAMLVAEGATNREAAATLFLSPKTIEAHLGRIYRKLGVRSRTELARRLPPPVPK